jgi:hypothetical protein
MEVVSMNPSISCLRNAEFIPFLPPAFQHEKERAG